MWKRNAGIYVRTSFKRDRSFHTWCWTFIFSIWMLLYGWKYVLWSGNFELLIKIQRFIVITLRCYSLFRDVFASSFSGYWLLRQWETSHNKTEASSSFFHDGQYIVHGCIYICWPTSIRTFEADQRTYQGKISTKVCDLYDDKFFISGHYLWYVFIFEYFQGMMALAGLSYASIVVSSFSRAQNRVLQMGFADDMNTYVMISGMMNIQ